jgi:hypothetical protein
MKTLQEIIDFYSEDFRKEYTLYLETDKKVYIINSIRHILEYHQTEDCKSPEKRMENVKYLFSFFIHYPEVISFNKKFEDTLFAKCESLLQEPMDEECKSIISRFYEYKLH